MFDDDPRSGSDPRERDDDTRDRERVDPRDAFVDSLDLPRGLERELVRDRDVRFPIRLRPRILDELFAQGHELVLRQLCTSTTKRSPDRSDERVSVEGGPAGCDCEVREVLHTAVREAKVNHRFDLLGEDGFSRYASTFGEGMSVRSVGNCSSVAVGVIASPKRTSI